MTENYLDTCASSPVEMTSPPHECLEDEACCAYCGVRLVYPCNGCGHFLSASDMHATETRCEVCR